MGIFGYSGAFKTVAEMRAFMQSQVDKAQWLDRWTSAAAAGDSDALGKIKVDIAGFERLWRIEDEKNRGGASEAVFAGGYELLSSLMQSGREGEKAAEIWLAGGSKEFWRAARASTSWEWEIDLMVMAMSRENASLAKALFERGWSPDRFDRCPKPARPSPAGPWGYVCWKSPSVVGKFKKAWDAAFDYNAPDLGSTAMEADFGRRDNFGKRSLQPVSPGFAMLFQGPGRAVGGDSNAGLGAALSSIDISEWVKACASQSLDSIGAVLDFECAPADPLVNASGGQRLAVAGARMESQKARKAWIAILFEDLKSSGGGSERKEALVEELKRAGAGPGDMALSGKSLESEWAQISGSESGLVIARMAGGAMPWAPQAAPILRAGVNESPAFAEMLARLERRPENVVLVGTERDLALADGSFSWGWRDGQGITPLMVVCSAAIKDVGEDYDGVKRLTSAEKTALSILASKGARDSLDAQAEGLGFTVLMMAVDRGYDKLAEALIDAGADPRAKDFQGRTAMDRAGAKLALRLGVKMARAAKALEANESARSQIDVLTDGGLSDVSAKLRTRAAYPGVDGGAPSARKDA